MLARPLRYPRAVAVTVSAPRFAKRLTSCARPWPFVTARSPASRTVAPGRGEDVPLRTAVTRTRTVARRPTRTRRGDTVTRRRAGAGAAHVDEVGPVGRTATERALAPGQAEMRRTSSPAVDATRPPRTSTA